MKILNNENIPLITTITLNYNNPYIYEAIDSVLKQDYPKIQYIIIDDGSKNFNKENIFTYIMERKKSNIIDFKVVYNPVNIGTVKTSNIALNLSNGKYIFNLSGDDCFTSDNVISNWVAEFIRTKALIMTAYRDVYDDSLKNKLSTLPLPEQVKAINTSTPRKLFNILQKGNFISGSCTARSMECIEKFGLYDENINLIEDYSMQMALLSQNIKIHFFSEVVIKYRSGGISDLNNVGLKYINDMKYIYNKIIIPNSTKKITGWIYKKKLLYTLKKRYDKFD